MNFSPPIVYSKRQSTFRLPMSNGSHFGWWKARMEDFIQAEDYELWDRITIGPTIPIKIVEGVKVPKVRIDFTAENLSALRKNANTKNILLCGLGPDKYNRISNCTSAKQIWDALVDAYEGTSQVWKFIVDMLFTEYETFKMIKVSLCQK